MPSRLSSRANSTSVASASVTAERCRRDVQVVAVLHRPPERLERRLATCLVGSEDCERACPVDRLRCTRRLDETELAKLRDRFGDRARKLLRHLGCAEAHDL